MMKVCWLYASKKTALKFDLDSYKLLLKMLSQKKTRVLDLAG